MLPVIEYDADSTIKELGVSNVVGKKRWIQSRLYPLLSRAGDILNIVDIEEDITERKLAEQKIIAYQERLKALTSQLTIAEEKERHRIAANLHDHIGQTLAFSRIQLTRVMNYTSDDKLKSILDLVSKSLLKTIQDTKEIVFELSSPLLHQIGLSAAISNWLEVHVQKKCGIEVEFNDDIQKKTISDDLRIILFRNARELLTNVIKHSQASHVIVSLISKENILNIVVHDNGIGFNPEEATVYSSSSKGFGLFSIKGQMEDFGGSLEIISEPGKGCKAILQVPHENHDNGLKV